MAYELTIAEGKGRGQRFQFDAPDVTIGRGAENDVVLNDPGVSRNHARIQRSGPGYQLLDNGSANGTELNGSVIEAPTWLRDGDRIGVGPITFRFEDQRSQAITPPPTAANNDATRITSAPKAGAAAPRAESRPGEKKGDDARDAERRDEKRDDKREEKRNDETRVSALPAQGEAKVVALKAGGALAAPSGVGLWFASLPPRVRLGILGVGALLLVGAVFAWARGQKTEGPVCPEVIAIEADSIDVAVGRGVVDVDCGSKAAFGFNAPAKTRVLFHYEVARIATPSELELKLNGKHLAWAPVAGARPEAQVVSVPDDLLSPDGRNIVAFVESQKDKEWSVSKVRTELLAITPGNLKEGEAAYERGRRKFEERKVAPRNLYDAWKFFTAARLSLEGLNPRPPLYGEVAQLIKDTEKELDKECSRLIFTAQRQEKYGQDDKAQLTYREILTHFPGEEPTGCRKKASDNIVSAPVGN